MSQLLAYNIVGKGKPVVLLHGFLENKNMWNFLAYSDWNDFQYIMIDLPGHGNSVTTKSELSMEYMAEKVLEVLQEENIDNAHFVGHSMGGYVSLALAESHPEVFNSLGLFFSSPFEDNEEKKEQRTRAIDIAEKNKNDFIRFGVRNLFNPYELDNMQDEIQQATDMAMGTSMEGVIGAIRGMRDRKDTSAVLQANNFPKCWIYGEFDTAVDANKVEQFLVDLPLIEDYKLPIGHMGQWESPAICRAIINDFLKDK